MVLQVPLPENPRFMAMDFEASALPGIGSYPVEFGVCDVRTLEVRSWLIKPTKGWLENGYWDDAAESVHGITPERLQREGVSPGHVLEELRALVDQDTVFLTDTASADLDWFDKLCLAASTPFPIHCKLLSVVVSAYVGFHGQVLRDAMDDVENAVKSAFPDDMHRAGPDAFRIAQQFRTLTHRYDL